MPMHTSPSALPGLACLAIPSLAFACELAERPALAGEPAALTDEAGLRVVEVTARARAHGVRPGLSVREAAALCPPLVVVEPRPARVQRIAETLVEAMASVSPVIEEAAPGVVFADLHGTERLIPHLDDLARIAFAAVPRTLQPRLGVAGHRFTAQMAAHRAEPRTALAVHTEEAAAFLAREHVSHLPLDEEAVERLLLLGIDSCGALARLPRHAVEAQFGPPGGRAWLAARGEDPTPLTARPWERERVVEQVQAEPPLVSKEAVALAVEQLLGRALRHASVRHRSVRTLRLRGETERGQLWERHQVLREPSGDRARLWTALRPQIEYAQFPGPLARIELELGGLTAESARQRSLFHEQVRRREQLDEMVRHLKVRFGASPVARVVAVEPWHRLPERRYALLDYDP